MNATTPVLTSRGESRLAQKPGQPPYFAHREVPSNQCACVAKYGDCPRLLRFGPFCNGLLKRFALLTIASAGMHAQRGPLTLAQAVDAAVQNYPSIRVSQEQMNAAAAGIRLAQTAYLPEWTGWRS